MAHGMPSDAPRSTDQTLGASRQGGETSAGDRRARVRILGRGVRPVGVYQRDSAMEPQCNVCVSQLESISTIAPKSLHDSWDTRQ